VVQLPGGGVSTIHVVTKVTTGTVMPSTTGGGKIGELIYWVMNGGLPSSSPSVTETKKPFSVTTKNGSATSTGKVPVGNGNSSVVQFNSDANCLKRGVWLGILGVCIGVFGGV